MSFIILIIITLAWTIAVVKVSLNEKFESKVESVSKPIFVWCVGELYMIFTWFVVTYHA